MLLLLLLDTGSWAAAGLRTLLLLPVPFLLLLLLPDGGWPSCETLVCVLGGPSWRADELVSFLD